MADVYYNEVVIASNLHCGLAILYGLPSDKYWRHGKYHDITVVHGIHISGHRQISLLV